MIEDLTHETFSAHMGDTFRLVPPAEVGEPLDLELVDLRTFDATDLAKRAQSFAVEFRGPKDKGFAQGVWHLEHAELGALDIFLVPVGPDEEGLRYEAVFN